MTNTRRKERKPGIAIHMKIERKRKVQELGRLTLTIKRDRFKRNWKELLFRVPIVKLSLTRSYGGGLLL